MEGSGFELIAQWGRAVVGSALLLSAFWKLRNRVAFRTAYRATAPRRLRRFDTSAALVFPTVEMVVGLATVLPWTSSRIGAAAALLLTIGLTQTVPRADESSAGCGCWRNPEFNVSRTMYLVRNGLLASFAAVGLVPGPVGVEAWSVTLAAGVMTAILVMEAPSVWAIAISRSAQRGEEAG